MGIKDNVFKKGDLYMFDEKYDCKMLVVIVEEGDQPDCFKCVRVGDIYSRKADYHKSRMGTTFGNSKLLKLLYGITV